MRCHVLPVCIGCMKHAHAQIQVEMHATQIRVRMVAHVKSRVMVLRAPVLQDGWETTARPRITASTTLAKMVAHVRMEMMDSHALVLQDGWVTHVKSQITALVTLAKMVAPVRMETMDSHAHALQDGWVTHVKSPIIALATLAKMAAHARMETTASPVPVFLHGLVTHVKKDLQATTAHWSTILAKGQITLELATSTSPTLTNICLFSVMNGEHSASRCHAQLEQNGNMITAHV
eukprot:GHVO01067218.1.p2 GENE.GHVO01067218.1~~GHVO01067218.1.p2  ORF type:complete len:234 (+),score=27.30 GHVO01067218.1:243-944(+)